jgi:hypothetical protein
VIESFRYTKTYLGKADSERMHLCFTIESMFFVNAVIHLWFT